ncbi:MAG: hypothetical protein NT154_01290 [Verrucomicrobia bacterium]|nr:hypothetical protein [Verrucomicrobiota bacterium]
MRQIETSASRIDGLAFDGSYLWSVDRQQRRVHKLDVNTGDEILSFAAPGTGNWAAGLTFYDNHLWQLDCQERRLYGLDPLGGVVQASFPLKGTSPTGLAVLAGEAYVADWVDKTIYVYQLSTGVLLRELPAPTVPIWGATTDGTYLWFVNHYGREVHVVAPARWQLVTSLPIGIEAPTGAAFDGEGIWLSNALNGTLVKLRVYADQCWMVTDSTCARHVFLRTFRNNSNNPQNLLLNSVLPIDMPNQLVDSLNSVFQPASRIVEPQPSGLRYAITQYGTINPQDYVQFAASVLLRKGVLRNVLFPHQVANIQNIPNDFCALWTNDIPEARFSLNTAIVQSAARAAVGGETNVFWMTMAIHDYVINHVRYGYPAWKPVDQVLTSGIGVCDDFARTMVALCRLNGIPARTAGGQDHVTVEVWMPGPNVWFPADPTNVSGDPDGTLWQRRVTWGRSDRVINGVLNPGWTGWQYTLWQWPGFDSYYDDYVDTVVDKNTGPIFNGFHTPPRLVNNRVTCRVYDAFDPENDYPVLYRAYVSATPDFFSTASCVFETTNSTMSIPVGNNFHPD